MKFVKRIKENRAIKQAQREAEADEYAKQRRREYLQEQREIDAPILAKLEQYAGRIILVTNPSDDPENIPHLHSPIAEAIHAAMPDNTNYRVSMHTGTSPYSGRGIITGTGFVVDKLRELARGEVTYASAVQSLGSSRGIDPSSIKQAMETEFFGPLMGTNPNLAHIAVTTALGIERVNLDYDNARYGDTFVYQGANEHGDMQWERIFSHMPNPRPHHLH